jgi:hypothetical protein
LIVSFFQATSPWDFLGISKAIVSYLENPHGFQFGHDLPMVDSQWIPMVDSHDVHGRVIPNVNDSLTPKDED